MEGMFWGVAAMVVKDAVKQQYLKARDYARNVRQVYRDVDNLSIAVDHVKANCQPEDLDAGPHAPFIRRAERQLRDAYRTLDKVYPLKPSTSKLVEYASRPGGEMHLLDIGKEANQTARGLGDLLSEIRFAKIGGGSKDESSSEEQGPGDTPPQSSPQPAPFPTAYDMLLYQSNAFPPDGSGSPRTTNSDQSSLFDHTVVQPSSIYSPSTDSSRSGRRRSSSARQRRRDPSPAAGERAGDPPSSRKDPRPLGPLFGDRVDREHALDSLQDGIEQVLGACDEDREGEAMGYLERALSEVIRLQKTRGFAGCRADEDLGDAVEELDHAMTGLAGAGDEREKKRGLRRLGRALEEVDAALAERQRHKERGSDCRRHRIAAKSSSPVGRALVEPPRHGGTKRRQSTQGRGRRYSVQ